VEGSFGQSYRDMVTDVRQTLADLGEHFPTYQGQGFDMAGFVWFSGWGDLLDPNYVSYTEHMAHFIRDVRADFKVPHLSFVIGQLGVESSAADPNYAVFKARQAAVVRLPEFAGNVKLVATAPFWDREAYEVYKKGWRDHQDEWDRVGSDYPFHYLGSAKTICQIGRAFGEAMIELHRSRAKK
jgi:alpha-galactosidase